MPRRARRQLQGPSVAAILLAGAMACGRAADAPSRAAEATPPPAATAAATARAACTSAPLTVRIDDIRREGADSLRVAVTLAHTAPAPAGAAAAPPTAVADAVRALEGMSLVTADGRRRLFALRSSSGERVGPPVEAPPPGGTSAFWALFPAAEGPLTVLLPGCAPLTGLAVTPALRAGRPEP